jgi:hypothetical protein
MTPLSRRWIATMVLPAISGCGLLFPGPPRPSDIGAEPAVLAEPEPAAPTAVPVGMGSLRLEEVSVILRRGDLEIQVTPLAESITRVTAPDTHERLSALSRSYQAIFLERTGSATPFQLFLVALHSEIPDVTFEPEDLNIVNRGLRYRPVDIQAVTPDWDMRRLSPRQASLAVYAFPGNVDLERSTEFEYREMRSREWDRVLPVIIRERNRVLPQDSLPN